MKIKTASDLKFAVEQSGEERYFFTRDSMKFFGDTMKNYGIREHDDCFELYRRKPVKHGLVASAYFSKITFERMFNKD